MELTWNKVIVGGFTLCTVVAGATWSLRADRIEELNEKLEFYKKSEVLNLPDTLAAIKIANSDIQENLSSLTDYHETKKENTKLTDQLQIKDKSILNTTTALSKAQKELEQQNNEHQNEIKVLSEKHRSEIKKKNRLISEKQAVIDDVIPRSTEFELSENKSKSLFASKIIVGVVDVKIDHVVVTFNNEERNMLVGEFNSIEIEKMNCRVILSSFSWGISDEGANFKVICVNI